MKDSIAGSIVFNHLVTGVRPGKKALVREFCSFLALKALEKVQELRKRDLEKKEKNSYEIISFNLKHEKNGVSVELFIDVNLFNDAKEYKNIAVYDFYEYDVIREFFNRNRNFKKIDYEYIEINEKLV
jgi:hypothetical protein